MKMRRTLAWLAAALMLCCCFVPAVADGTWTCPRCGRENPERANFCGGCREPKPAARVESYTMSNAWVCPSCGEVCPDGDSFCMICAEQHRPEDQPAWLVAETETRTLTPMPAVTEMYPGSFSAVDETRVIRYTAPVTGQYYLWLDQANSGFRLRAIVRDAGDYTVRREVLSQGDGFSFELTAGKAYAFSIEQYSSVGNYTLRLGVPRAFIDLNGCQVIEDSIAYNEQQNRYRFVAPVTGVYRFWIARANSGVRLSLMVYDAGGYRLRRETVARDEGMSVTLTAGETYDLYANQYSDRDSYTLCVGMAREPVDITGCAAVGDRISFVDQENAYEYSIPETGDYVLNLSRADKDLRVSVSVFDAAGYRLNRTTLTQGDSLRVTLTGGQRYTFQVKHYSGMGNYVLCVQ